MSTPQKSRPLTRCVLVVTCPLLLVAALAIVFVERPWAVRFTSPAQLKFPAAPLAQLLIQKPLLPHAWHRPV